MIPKISRGSNPAGLVRYLFGPGRFNEHADQHVVCASGDLLDAFDFDGHPRESYARIGRRFDRRYTECSAAGESMPRDRRGSQNPERREGMDRVWHCSLSVKAGQGIHTDQEWEDIVRDYLTRMGMNPEDEGITWLAVRHGLSRGGNDHVHVMVQLAARDGWLDTWNDMKRAQRSCREMERERPELVQLARSDTRQSARYRWNQWRRWAEWKARQDHADWDTLPRRKKAQLIAGVVAETMPRQHVALIVEACAAASRSEDEFIRRVRREGLMIDPFLRRGTSKDDFRNPNQVTGYRITWRSTDGWVERIGAKDLSDGLRLKALRKTWMSDPRSDVLAVQEWRASMENRPPFLDDGRERQPAALSTHDLERIIDEAFQVALQLKSADDPDAYRHALKDGLHTFDMLQKRYGIGETTSDETVDGLMMQIPTADQDSALGR